MNNDGNQGTLKNNQQMHNMFHDSTQNNNMNQTYKNLLIKQHENRNAAESTLFKTKRLSGISENINNMKSRATTS